MSRVDGGAGQSRPGWMSCRRFSLRLGLQALLDTTGGRGTFTALRAAAGRERGSFRARR